uniref:NADH dehydrogenase subunit 6 n=1 Tax=Thyropygus sp. DVL-2001 TaxID=174155 RepID=Q8WA85_9MYRI|nr:NADH dehydrogenase subunit 6 [Thyropygus sp. DVL-2001]AAL18222.1 NADH dehydrogenase subunit 6 [Thyropygus sp. DVL-2001]
MLITALMMMSIIITFPLMFHPMMMGLTIIMLALTISMKMWLTLKYSWLAYILFLIFLGALLVLFIYISTLAPNEKFMKMSLYPFILFPLTLIMPNQPSAKDSNIIETDFIPSMKIFSMSLLLMTLFMALYLFLTLLIISKITMFKEGPLRLTT